jgi:hypothetical protein
VHTALRAVVVETGSEMVAGTLAEIVTEAAAVGTAVETTGTVVEDVTGTARCTSVHHRIIINVLRLSVDTLLSSLIRRRHSNDSQL